MAPPALDVWLYGAHVATVTERRTGKFQLTYTDAAFDRWPRGRPVLSVALPLVPETHPPGTTGPFLEGLLPEGEARTVLEARYAVRRGDVRGLLAEIGRDCAGAVVVQPAGDPPPRDDAGTGNPRAITDEELARDLSQLPVRPLGDDDRVRVSLAGQQAKLLLVRLPNGRWARPVDGHPSTHILKPGDDRYPHSVANEAFCLRVAKALNLTDIGVEVLDIDGRPVLGVSRYDRTRRPGGAIARIHQEDFCQALAVNVGPLGSGKYEHAGGPALGDVARILDVHNGDPEQTTRLAEVITFTVVIGNADAHGKNLALLHPEDGPPRLAPLYDVMSTVHYPTVHTPDGPRRVSTNLAMRVNDRTSINAVTVQDILAETARWHRGGTIDERVHTLVERLPAAIAQAAAATPGVPGALVDRIAQRAAALAAGGAAGSTT